MNDSSPVTAAELLARAERIARRQLLLEQSVTGTPSSFEWNDSAGKVTVTFALDPTPYTVRYTPSMRMLRNDLAKLVPSSESEASSGTP